MAQNSDPIKQEQATDAKPSKLPALVQECQDSSPSTQIQELSEVSLLLKTPEKPSLMSRAGETVCWQNYGEAVSVACKAFPSIADQRLIIATYFAWNLGIRLIPNPTDGILSKPVMLESYVLYRDQSHNPIAVGGLYRHPFNTSTYWLGWLGVDPAAQGAGLGRQVVESLEALAASRGGERMKVYHLSSDTSLHSFKESDTRSHQQEGLLEIP